MPGLYELSLADLDEVLEGEPPYRARQVWDGLYRRGEQPLEMTVLPGAVRRRLALVPSALNEVAHRSTDGDRTAKWLFELHDGFRIETVLMRYERRATVCVSSQAGCAMACSFCATGQMGFARHLSVGEIVEQVVLARRAALPQRLSNVVFMGMGEPLANYDNVWESVTRINGHMGLSARHLTISTVGIVPGIRRLSAESLPVSLAVSLHAANDELRSSLVPINRRYPISVLMQACEEYVTRTGRRISFEWALIDGVNDSNKAAVELAELARPLRAHVNLIALNPTPGFLTRGSTAGRVRAFQDALESLGVNVTVRSTRGVDIDAGMRPIERFVAAGKHCVNLGITAFLTDRTIGPAEFACQVEERGFHSLYLPEHTHLPVEADVPPALVEGVSTDDYRRGLDPYASLAAAASVTTTLKLGTGVSLVAQHDPIVLAKQIATIDHISGGRFVLGIGFGWNRVEAADHGVAFGERRAVARVKVLCMKALWSEDQAEFHGRYVQLPPSWAWPKPVQKPWVPTLIGGGPGPSTFGAIAEYADGWMPVGGSGIASRLSELRREFVARDRDPSQLRVVPFGTIPSPGKLDHLAVSGATEVVLRVPAGDTSDMLRCLDEYRTYLDQAR